MQGRRLLIVLVALLLAGALFVVYGVPHIERTLRPRLVAARVAIEVGDSGVARGGHTTAAAGTPFVLHAVVEAVTRSGAPLYYTDAPALELQGEAVPAARIEPWQALAQGEQKIKVRWFTVEGPAPHVALPAAAAPAAALPADVRLLSFLHPELGSVPSARGTIDSNFEAAAGHASPRDFGTQRFMAWVELFEHQAQVVPGTRLESPGPERVAELAREFAGITLRLPGGAGAASELFGLTGVTLEDGAPPALLERAVAATTARLWFTKLTALRAHLASAGTPVQALAFTRVALDDGPAFGGDERAAHPGDLLQAGARTVVLFRDRGVEGRLDPADLCFDFERGAVVRPLADVFTGSGELEWARLAAGK